ncbi:hypothetical protein WGM54_17120 [Paenibacillus polymyxa]|uniref:hypothetical protein n=1 Tax=Paenibacillus polymyxa TaxID=1406 RepID=UPI00307F0EA5
MKVKLHIDSGHDAGAMWFAYSTVYSSPDGSGWYSLVIIEKNGFFPMRHTEQMPVQRSTVSLKQRRKTG